jgi:serine/threonine protein kinase
MTLAAGSRFGPYVILGPIGSGGMGEVYRARDPRLDREVAVKVLADDVAGHPDRLRRFEEEARAVAALNHPGLLAVFDVGTKAGRPYIVSELLEGETLRQVLSRGPLPLREALELARQVAAALSAAHEKGVVHRDLKPDNLFLTRDGRMKILDFGLARRGGPAEPGEVDPEARTATGTRPGTVLGTVGYMSPEQVRGEAVDLRADIFAFGCVLYEMLSGRRAFKGATAAETMTAILKEEPPPALSGERPLPPTLERVLRHCLEKSPERRFHSAHDLALALDAVSTASAADTPPGTSARAIPRWLRRLSITGLAMPLLATASWLAWQGLFWW